MPLVDTPAPLIAGQMKPKRATRPVNSKALGPRSRTHGKLPIGKVGKAIRAGREAAKMTTPPSSPARWADQPVENGQGRAEGSEVGRPIEGAGPA